MEGGMETGRCQLLSISHRAKTRSLQLVLVINVLYSMRLHVHPLILDVFDSPRIINRQLKGFTLVCVMQHLPFASSAFVFGLH